MRLYSIISIVALTCLTSVAAQPLEDAARQLSTAANELTITNFPVTTSETGTLQLRRRRSAVDATTQWYVPTATGDKKVSNPELTLFSGEVVGAQGSKVWLAYAAATEQMFGIVQYANGASYVLGPSSEPGAKSAEHVIAATTAIQLSKQVSFTCTAGELTSEQMHRESKYMTPMLLEEKPLLQVDLAVETDVEFFKATGSSLEKAQAYTAALYSVLSAIYEDEVRITVHLPWVKTWTDDPADPYMAKGDPFILRDAAIPYWKNSYQAVQRDVYQVLTSSSVGSGGFGYYDALCDKNGDYGMSTASVQGKNALPTFAFSYDVYIVAHELGHNFNADHTHNCSWNPPLDTCIVGEGLDGGCFGISQQPKPNPGSIMSYCGGINNDNGLGYQVRMTLLPQVAAVMRTTIEAATCVFAPSNSIVTLLSPNGQETYAAGVRTNIRWRATPDVGWVRLEYSKNGGAQWTSIESQIESTLETYSWLVPQVCSNRMLVRIVSTFDTAVADVSMQVFTVTGLEDADGLIAWYPLDGNSDDYAACGYYPANGNAILAPDRFDIPNRAYSFSGSTNLVAPAFKTDFNMFTVACWFKVADRADVQTLLAQDWSGAGSTFMLYSWQGTLGAALYMEGEFTPAQIWGPALTPNQWYHAAYIYDGTNARLYVNGVEGTPSAKAGTLARHTSPLFIGSRGIADYLRGSIDEIRIYRRALSAEEVATMYNGTSGIDDEATENTGVRLSAVVDAYVCNATVSTEHAGIIELLLCDQLGKCVAKLNAGYRDAGTHTFALDVSSVTSGAYYLLTKCSDRLATESVLIVR